MAKLVEAAWVAERIGAAGFMIVDPRRPMKYLAGHLPGAINVPMYKAFGADGKLLPPDALAEFIGDAGLADGVIPLLYDSPEGQNAAMLAWLLEYLGRTDVIVILSFYEAWKAAGREVLYRPTTAPARKFSPMVDRSIRAEADELRDATALKFVDFRSAEEFAGARAIGDDAPGHIPGARNLVWRELSNPPEVIVRSPSEVEEMVARAGIGRGDRIVAYCRSGPRAALGYMALRASGYDVRLFDGSWAEWSRLGLPVEK